jgi:hypothetical protein
MKYGVIYNVSIHHEGDERSRTHPGHGYPAYTENVETFKSFETEDLLKNWIRTNKDKTYKVIKYEEVKVTLRLDVDLS